MNMVRARLRTKFLLSMILISAGLTSISLLLVRESVQSQITKEIFSDLRNSVSTFQNFQREKEVTLSHSADLVAYLPITRNLMLAPDAATIQDGSIPIWHLAGSDLLVLAIVRVKWLQLTPTLQDLPVKWLKPLLVLRSISSNAGGSVRSIYTRSF